MSYSNQSYYQCEDCSRNILERKNKKHCRTCGKTLCLEYNYSHFGYCNDCIQKFETRPVEEKYNIMKMFRSALKTGPIFLTVFAVIFGISSLVLFTIFLIRFLSGSDMDFIFGYIAAGQFPLSLLFFWLAGKVRNKNERGLNEVERRIVEFKNQISLEGPSRNRSFSTQYRQTSPNVYQRVPESQPIPSEIPIKIIKDPEKRKKIAYTTLLVFASILMIAGVIHIGLSFSWYPFIFISMGEIGFSSFLFWLGSGIKKGKWTKTQGDSGNVRIIRNPNEALENTERSKKSLKRVRIVLWVFIILLGIAGITHPIVFFAITFPDPFFAILGGIELIVTFLLILLNKVVKNKLESLSV